MRAYYILTDISEKLNESVTFTFHQSDYKIGLENYSLLNQRVSTNLLHQLKTSSTSLADESGLSIFLILPANIRLVVGEMESRISALGKVKGTALDDFSAEGILIWRHRVVSSTFPQDKTSRGARLRFLERNL